MGTYRSGRVPLTRMLREVVPVVLVLDMPQVVVVNMLALVRLVVGERSQEVGKMI